MFSTHFHLLIEDFKIYDNIKKFHMTFEEHRDKIKFLYKFREGYVPHSFGINVARLAGLPVFNLMKNNLPNGLILGRGH